MNFDAHLHKNSTSSPTSLLRYHKDLVNLLFWVIWACQAIPTKINRTNQPVGKFNVYICMQKINFIPPFFFITNLLFWVLLAYLAI